MNDNQIEDSKKEVKCPPLWAALLMDAIGMASMFIPAFGAMIDGAWAIISAAIFYYWYRMPIGTIGAFIEEICPITDVIPSFTIAYLITKKRQKQNQ